MVTADGDSPRGHDRGSGLGLGGLGAGLGSQGALDRITDDLVLRTVCDKSMKLTNLYGKVPSKVLEDSLFSYEEENGGAPRIAPRKK